MSLITRIAALVLLLVVWASSTLDYPPGAVQAAWQMAQVAGPALTIPGQVPAQAGGAVTVPVTFAANGNQISSLIFSVDYDETWLSLSPTDGNGDGVPDAVVFNVPAAFVASATFDGSDTDGEIDIVIADMFPPLAGLPDRDIVSIRLNAGSPGVTTEAAVRFSQHPAASFGSISGASVAGSTDNGSVLIEQSAATGTPTPTVTPTATSTPTSARLPGDVNRDGRVDGQDVQLVAGHWNTSVGNPDYDPDCDVDGSGDVDIVDIAVVAGQWGAAP